MGVIKKGYHCPDCGDVDGKMWWSNEENNLVVSCSKCGQILQTHDESMYTTSLTRRKD